MHSRIAAGLMVLIMIVGVLVVWWRNHDILRDQFDYSIVIAAAGKVAAGYKPYTDIPSPMQSSVYLLNYFSEQIFGRNYFGLTLGGLVQALGGGLLLLGLLRRPLGGMGALVLALAVVMAGLLQHAVFFYNPVGILSFSVVLLGLAVEPSLWPIRSGRTVVILMALFVSGINKVNFHGLILMLAGLLSIASWRSGKLLWPGLIRNGLVLGVFGGVLPVAFELGWTGATYGQWIENVLLAPTARHDYLTQLLGVEMYGRPVYDFYPHMLVPCIGGVGLGLLLITGGWTLYAARAEHRALSDWVMRLLLVLLGGVAGAALMITNHETVLLTSLAYPVTCAVLFLQYRNPSRARDRGMGVVLCAGILVWVVAGGYAAWHGSRILYGPNPPPREAYVSWTSEYRALSYFEGVRMQPDQFDALQRTAGKLEEMEDSRGMLPDVLFGAGLEWFERYYPQSIVRHAPIWLHAGTTLHDHNKDAFARVLNHGERRLFTQKAWQSWPPSVALMINKLYVPEDIGSRDLVYQPRGPRPPPAGSIPAAVPAFYEFRSAVESNVVLASTQISDAMGVEVDNGRGAFGARRNTNWAWPLGSNALHGLAVARLAAKKEEAAVVTFRIIAEDPENGRVVWQRSARVDPTQPETEMPFSIYSGGRSLWLQTMVSPDGTDQAFGGWRTLRITHSNEQDRSPPPALSAGLYRIEPASTDEEPQAWWYVSAAPVEGWAGMPAEHWRRMEPRLGVVRVTVALRRTVAQAGEPINVMLAWYRAGRFEIMTERLVEPGTTDAITLEGMVAEPGGWIGLLTRHGVIGDMTKITGWEN